MSVAVSLNTPDSHYDPSTGRFLTADPIGFAAGDTNLYRYVLNNPTNFKDPSGKILPLIGAIAGGATSAGSFLASNPDATIGQVLAAGVIGAGAGFLTSGASVLTSAITVGATAGAVGSVTGQLIAGRRLDQIDPISVGIGVISGASGGVGSAVTGGVLGVLFGTSISTGGSFFAEEARTINFGGENSCR